MSVDVTLPQPYDNLRTRGLLTGSGNAAANATLLQARINVSGAGVVWLPPGTYYYDTGIIPKTGVKLMAAIRGATTLIYTGSVRAVDASIASRASGIYRAAIEGITFQFGGSGTTADGFYADGWRYSSMRDCLFTLFPGDGIQLVGSGDVGCWSNDWHKVESNINGGSGWNLGANTNDNQFVSCKGNLNGLDGWTTEKLQGCVFPGASAEGNGRHGFAVKGALWADLSSIYIEHQTPEFWSTVPPNYAGAAATRYGVYITQADDGTRSHVVKVGGMLQGAHNGTTIVTKAVIYAEHCNRLIIAAPYVAGAESNRSIQIQSTVDVVEYDIPDPDGLRDTPANAAQILGQAHDYGSGGRNLDYRGRVGRREGFANLLVNGGFDAEPVATSGVPTEWTSGFSGTWTREPGSDGGLRLVGTNVSGNQCFIYQDVTGPDVAYLATYGRGVLSFAAIVPTSNTQSGSPSGSQVRVVCYDISNNPVTGGGLQSWFFVESDTEVEYALPFPVPATTVKVRVSLYTSQGSASNTDVIKIDRMMLTPGEFPKFRQPRSLTEMGGRQLAPFRLIEKAGAPADTDFQDAPSGACFGVYDSSNNRLYVRGADGTWRYATLT